MALLEIDPQQNQQINGVHIFGEWIDGYLHTFAATKGWNKREFDLDVDSSGGHIDHLDHVDVSPVEETQLIFAALAELARERSWQTLPEPIITVVDPDGNLL